MATVTFYEKPGCANNTRQKQLLEAAGHQVIAKDLLTEDWTADRVCGLSSVHWQFGIGLITAHRQSNIGEIDPETQTEEEALRLMLENPLLIRRPLMQVGDSLMAGFDQELVDDWIGLQENRDNV